MHRIRSKIINNQSGAAALLMLVLMLASILTVTLSAGEIIRNGLKMGNLQYNTTKAYFAAEAGGERILYELRKPPMLVFNAGNCNSDECVTFNSSDDIITVGNNIVCTNDCTNASVFQTFSNNTKYHLKYSIDGLDTVLKSFGTYTGVGGQNLKRVIELRY